MRPGEHQRFVVFDVPESRHDMLCNVPLAISTLAKDLAMRRLRLIGPLPIPPDDLAYARIHFGRYRVLVQWNPYPVYPEPTYYGRVDVLAEPVEPAKSTPSAS